MKPVPPLLLAISISSASAPDEAADTAGAVLLLIDRRFVRKNQE